MSTYGPYAETKPSGQTGWVSGRRRPIPDHIRMMLGHLDGEESLTYTIWRAPNPESILVRRSDVGETFIQAAGSASGMTVEVRQFGDDGETHLYTVGKPQPAGDATVLLPMSAERAVRVFENEIFTADEAAEIFTAFHGSDRVPDGFSLRELDLSVDQSVKR